MRVSLAAGRTRPSPAWRGSLRPASGFRAVVAPGWETVGQITPEEVSGSGAQGSGT